MPKLKTLCLFCLILLLSFSVSVFAQSTESITFSTYYPSPYGSYNDLTVAHSLGVGTTTPVSYANLDVNTSNSKAIHTMDSVNGGLLIGYMGSTIQARTTADANTQDLLLQKLGGRVGIGTTAPAQTLDVAGYIKAAHPFFIASSNDGWRSGPTGWNTVVHNQVVAGNSGGWYNTSNGRFTAPVTGMYFFTAQHYVYSSASGAPYIHHTIGVNGNWNGAGNSSTSGSYTIFGQNMGNYDQSTSTTTLLYLNAGDYVNDNVYVATATYNYMYGTYSFFQGVLLYAQ
jgi:hypothetical protein